MTASASYRANRYRLLRALKVLGTELRVCEVRKLHLAKIEQQMTGEYSPTTVADTLTTVQGVFHWAVKHDLLLVNPLVGYSKPSRRTRNRIIEPAEFQALLRHSDPNFRCLLISARLTGCRPIELRSLVWEWVDLPNGFWVFPDHKTITQQRRPMPRIVPLPDPVLMLCQRLATPPHAAADHVFLNRHGKPYSKDCLVKKMSRVRDRVGIVMKANEHIVLYSNRHSFATGTVGKVSDHELATLMGHTDTQMIRRYVHLNAERLKDIRRRAGQPR